MPGNSPITGATYNDESEALKDLWSHCRSYGSIYYPEPTKM